jgi:uncharacterized phiE125 gp8 family phage protein
MALVLIAAPEIEPVTLAEAKAHLRLDESSEDGLVASFIQTSRLQIEATLGLALITQIWSYRLDKWPDGCVLELPLRPVQSVTAVRITAADGSVDTLGAERYLLDGASAPPRLHATPSPWPRPGVRAQGVEIVIRAGFGDEAGSVPPPIRQALLMLVAHWYENREPVLVGTSASSIPDTISALLAPYRTVRL